MNPKDSKQPAPRTGNEQKQSQVGSNDRSKSQPSGRGGDIQNRSRDEDDDESQESGQPSLQQTTGGKNRPAQPDAPLPTSQKKPAPGRTPNFGDQEPEDPRHIETEDFPTGSKRDGDSGQGRTQR